MIIGFVRRESHKHDKLRGDPEAQEIFSRMGCLNLFLKLNGYDDRISLEFA